MEEYGTFKLAVPSKIDFFIKKYCSIDLSNFKKLDKYRVAEKEKNVVIISDNETNLLGVKYTDSNDIINTIYKRISRVNDSMLHVVDKNDNNLLIDYKGNTILNLYDKQFIVYKNNYIKYEQGNHYGILDIDGNYILKCKYKEIEITKDGFIASNDDSFGVIDFQGNTIIPFKYFKINYSDCGLFILTNKKMKTGVKDKYGKKVIKEKYDYVKVINNNMFYFEDGNKGKCIISKDEKIVYKISDKYYPLILEDTIALYEHGKVSKRLLITDNDVIELNCDTVSHSINGIRYMMKELMFYLTDNIGNIISDEYDYAQVKDNTIYLKKNGVLYYVDENNNIVKYKKKPWDDYKILVKVNDDLVIANNEKNTMFIYSNNTIINTNELYEGGFISGNFIILYKDSYKALYTKDGNCIIPLIEKNIYVVGENKLVINNYVIDLSNEYLNFNFKYHLVIENNKECVVKTFDNTSDRDNYIEEIYEYSKSVNNELDDLNNKVLELKKEIERLKSIDLCEIDNKVLELKVNTNKK